MENECEALPGVAYPGVRDNRSTINTKTGYDDDDSNYSLTIHRLAIVMNVTMFAALTHIYVTHRIITKNGICR